jgi:hypothetical protein
MMVIATKDGLLSSRRLSRLIIGSTALLLASLAPGCGRPFNVKTQPGLPPVGYAAKASLDSIAVEANAITDEDFLYDTFDANLIAAGVLPVRLVLTNSGNQSVETKRARFEVKAPAGRFKAADARKAFKRLISYYGISAYSKAGYKESLEAFSSYALDLRTPLAASQSRQGLVYFFVPDEVARQIGLTLVIERLHSMRPADRAAIELRLN